MYSLYPNTQKSNVLSALTTNDATIWSADIFMGVVFALYITQNIEGGTAVHVGLILGLYRIVRAVLAVPIGSFLDKYKGHIDEYYSLVAASFITTIAYFALFFSTQLWQVYAGMLVIAVAHALDVTSWRILFYGNIPQSGRGKIMGLYDTSMQIAYSLATVAAGFVGDYFGFEWALVVAGILSLLGGVVMLLLYPQKRDF